MKAFERSNGTMTMSSLIIAVLLHLFLMFITFVGIMLIGISYERSPIGGLLIILPLLMLCSMVVMISEYNGKKRENVLTISLLIPIGLFACTWFLPSILSMMGYS